jgi:hypothetical protein
VKMVVVVGVRSGGGKIHDKRRKRRRNDGFH